MKKDRIQDLREKLGATQKELAQKFGICERTIRRWETGETHTPPFALMAIHWLLEHKG